MRTGAVRFLVCVLAGSMFSALLVLGAAPPDADAAVSNVIVTPDPASEVGQYSSLALDAEGIPTVAYYDEANGDLKILRCGNVTCTDGNSVIAADTAGDVGQWSSLALDASGLPAVAYYDATLGDLKLLRCGNVTCSDGNSITAADTVGDVGRNASLAFGPSGNAVIAFRDYSNDDLKVLWCGDPSCSVVDNSMVAESGGIGSFRVKMELDHAGLPLVLFGPTADDKINLFKCHNESCDSRTVFALLDVGSFPAQFDVEIDSTGLPVIVSNHPSSNLSLLRCGDSTCLNGNFATDFVDATSFRRDLSIALDSSDNLVMAYQSFDEDLYVFSCADATCSSGSEIAVADIAGFVGANVSMVLNDSDLPVAAYGTASFNRLNETLAVMTCLDAACSPCIDGPFAVANWIDLEYVTGCYNRAPAGTVTQVDIVADFELAFQDIVIDNATDAQLVIDGNGYTIDGIDGDDHGLPVYDGSLVVSNLTLLGGDDEAILLESDATADLTNVTIGGRWDGIEARGTSSLIVRNSTITGTHDAVWLRESASAVFENVTIADNRGDGLMVSDFDGSLTLVGSLIARNEGPDCTELLPVGLDVARTVFGDDSCTGVATPGLADSLDADGLALNGCTAPCTKTIALSNTSPALDEAGDCGLEVDQRGLPRPVGLCDAGAFELQGAVACPESSFVAADLASFHEAIDCYNLAPAGSVTQVDIVADFALTNVVNHIWNRTDAKLIIDGQGHTIDGVSMGDDHGLVVLFGDLELFDVTIIGGDDDAFVVSYDSSAVLTNVTIGGNEIGIYATDESNLIVRNSTITAGRSGVFLNESASVVFEHVTITDNRDHGLLVSNSQGSFAMSGSLIAGNDGPDCTSPLPAGADAGGNVFGDDSCTGVGSPGLADSLDPGGLAPNGCTAPCTETIALAIKSPAIDAAGDCGLDVDQRGFARPAGLCDAGAFEFQAPTALCAGQVVTQNLAYVPAANVGTPGDDVILGTPLRDRINALEGDDIVCAGGGRDIVRGGPGADEIHGGSGADRLLGGGGDDSIVGGFGDDVLDGRAGTDFLHGDGGDDLVIGGGGRDTIEGGDGADVVKGRGGIDVLRGGLGDDIIEGHTGSDRLRGDAGGDLLRGGAGNDFLLGGPGIDRCVGNTGPADQAETATCETTNGVEIFF